MRNGSPSGAIVTTRTSVPGTSPISSSRRRNARGPSTLVTVARAPSARSASEDGTSPDLPYLKIAFKLDKPTRRGDVSMISTGRRKVAPRSRDATLHPRAVRIAMDTAQTLLLNQGFEPIKVISWQRAISLLFLGKVEVLEEYDRDVRSVTMIIKVPAVVRLL